MIRAIASDNFPPFGKFQLEFKPVEEKPNDLGEVHLFTGVNGTGKTRILSVLAALLGSPLMLEKRLKKSISPIIFYVSRDLPLPHDRTHCFRFHAAPGGVNWHFNSQEIRLKLLAIPAFAYSGVAYVADADVGVLTDVAIPDRRLCLSFNRPETSSKELLQAIANLKVSAALDHSESEPNPQKAANPSSLVNALESTLSHVTGVKFQFQLSRFPKLSLAVNWGGNVLPFDVLPDGLRSLIGWMVHALVMMELWVQGKADPRQTEAIFLLDEPESHLHPAWQRKILPAFQRLFPKSQIFVATHSPFVIASLNHGWIHPLSLGSDGTVKFQDAKPASSGDSYVSVVEDIMGIKEWYDPETEDLLAKFRGLRDAAFGGKDGAEPEARKLASKIASRSFELQYIMGRELLQMDRQLAKNTAAA